MRDGGNVFNAMGSSRRKGDGDCIVLPIGPDMISRVDVSGAPRLSFMQRNKHAHLALLE